MPATIHPPLSPLSGRRWQVIIRGRRHPNGPMISETFNGKVIQADGEETVIDILHELLDHAADQTTLTWPESLSLHLFSPPAEPQPASLTEN